MVKILFCISPHKQMVLWNHCCLCTSHSFSWWDQHFSKELSIRFFWDFLVLFFWGGFGGWGGVSWRYLFHNWQSLIFGGNSFLLVLRQKWPQNNALFFFLKILSFDFPKSNLKGELLWYLFSHPKLYVS